MRGEYEELRFGTAVTNMVYRDPTITANSFATLNEISQGRAIIGMGTGDGPVYSLGRTATKLGDFEKGLRPIRDLLHDRGIDVPKSRERAGGNVQLKVGKRPVPIYISAEGPKTLRVAGRTCDGVILGAGFDKRVTDWARRRIAEGAKDEGRRLEDIDIMPAGMIVVDENGTWRAGACARAWPIARTTIFASRWKPFPRARRRGCSVSWIISISQNRSKSGSIPISSPIICSNASPSPARRRSASPK